MGQCPVDVRKCHRCSVERVQCLPPQPEQHGVVLGDRSVTGQVNDAVAVTHRGDPVVRGGEGEPVEEVALVVLPVNGGAVDHSQQIRAGRHDAWDKGCGNDAAVELVIEIRIENGHRGGTAVRMARSCTHGVGRAQTRGT